MSCPRHKNIEAELELNQYVAKSRQEMTFLKPQTDKEPITKKSKDKTNEHKQREKPLSWLHGPCGQACGWVLLTVGLCIIVITFYLAVYHKYSNDDDDDDNFGHIDAANIGIDTGVTLTNTASNWSRNGNSFGLPIHDNNLGYDDSGDPWLFSNEDSLYGSQVVDILGALTANLVGCKESSCKIACSRDDDIYKTLHRTMKYSSCPSIDVLLLDSQNFPNNMLANSWRPSNLSVYEVIIRANELTNIKSNAFNAPMFANTILMSWSNMDIERVESGSLLGLYRLKYLTVESRIQILEPAFFQPVQTTLSHLKLNANLMVRGNRNFFSVRNMTRMEYLDLSYNRINGSLGPRLFSSTPNLKYFIMTDAQIEHIEPNTFADLADTLLFLNLSKNLLTTLAAEVVEAILRNHVGAMINLSRNNWICNCELQELSEIYKISRNQFMDSAYCTAPHYLYGISIDEVNYEQQDCDLYRSTTLQGPEDEKEDTSSMTTTKMSSTNKYANTPPPMDIDSSDFSDSGETTPTDLTTVFKMRCLNVDSTETFSASSDSASSSMSSVASISSISSGSSSSSESSSDSSSFASLSAVSSEALERNFDVTTEVEYFQFPPPVHEFDLQLIPSNNSVIVVIENPEDLMIMIIWFSEQQEVQSVSYNDMSLDYECMRYAEPYLMVGPLLDNTTYTFCLVPLPENSISPFNCLPLHVPLKHQDNIWISQEHKHFTIGMLCLIFLVSTILGALVAYFGIKTYPDLLEGSKNVLVVKKPDQACYVATISETEYMKQASLKKQKPSEKEAEKKVAPTKEGLKKKSSIKLPLPATPDAKRPESPPPPFHMSVSKLESVSSLGSSSTCFDDGFPVVFPFKDEDYETPRMCENEYTLEQRCVQNNYGMSPGSPPPLPKRNSNISDTPTMVMNRFSRNI